MKSSIEVLIVLGSLLFGLAIGKWMNNFSPSFVRKDETEIVIEDVDVD